MAEIILPPEENEETPQAPELNIDKPTENSKVITIEFEAKKTNKVSTKDTNQQLYTTDTDAWFEFKETTLENANGTYSAVFRNRHDGSIFQRTGDVVNGVAYYKIPHQEIRHAGAWRGQIVYTLSNGDTTAREFGYDVKGHILDGKDVREIVVEDFETLMSQLRSMKDNAELELADLVNAAGRNELERQQFYESLVEDINDLQENYQELLDTGVLQTNINEKLEELEEEYAPKLTEVTTQLAQNEMLLRLKSYPKYGEIDLSEFEGLQHNIDFKLWRDPKDGIIKHDWELDDSDYEVRYVSNSGRDANDGLTPETAWGNLIHAIDEVEADTNLSKVKIIMVGWMRRNDTVVQQGKNISKKYIIESEFPIASNENVSWTDEYGLKKGVTPKPNAVVRIDERDVKGNPLEFLEVGSVSECQTTKNSFFYDGTNVFVNRDDTTNENTYVLVSQSLYYFRLSQNAEIIFNDIELFIGAGGNSFRFDSQTNVEGSVLLNDVRVVYYGGRNSNNGIATDGIKDIKLFDCKVFNAYRDGFNYHNTKTKDATVTVFEYNCYAENAGVDESTTNNNISSAHEGIHIIRIGTKGTKSRGPLIADVNGCYSLCIDCSVSDTRYKGLNWGQNAAFYFDDRESTYVTNPNGKAWLINCSGGSSTEWSINTDSVFKEDASKLLIDNFHGNYIPEDLAFEVL